MSAAQGADGSVLFLVGMRINKIFRPWKWLPVLVAMPAMLAELRRDRSLGLIGTPRTLWSGRTIVVWQYWDSFDHLERYARAGEHQHLTAWRNFNRRSRSNDAVGIFHETVLLSDRTVETIYANMPLMGLAQVTGAVSTSSRGETAALRLGGRDSGPETAPST